MVALRYMEHRGYIELAISWLIRSLRWSECLQGREREYTGRHVCRVASQPAAYAQLFA
jgi:hypothetical protein